MAADPIQTSVDLPNKAYLLPQSIPMWPPVWWTWLILVAIILLIGTLVFYKYKAYKKRAYRREALAVISNITDELPDKDCISLCHEIIRRCLISEGKYLIAALPNVTLLEKIDGDMPVKYRFSSLGNDFINGPYRHQIKLTPEQRSAILKTTLHWVRKHHA
ncbi:MAG: DUF4381 domain-containing protein [Marinomonas colpomeniae]